MPHHTQKAKKVVRDSLYGRGKYHLPDDTMTRTLCGIVPSCSGRFPTYGDRANFERVCPERICKRCRKAEAEAI